MSTDFFHPRRRRPPRQRLLRFRRERAAAPQISAAEPRGLARNYVHGIALALLSLAGGALLAPRVWQWSAQLRESEALVLREISVLGLSHASAREVLQIANLPEKISLLDVDLLQIAEQAEKHPWVAHARATLLPPDRLIVQVEERLPQAVVRSASTAERFLVDASGTAFIPILATEWPHLPTLRSYGAIARGEPDPALALGIELALRIAASPLPAIAEVEVHLPSPQHFALRLRDSRARILLGEGDFDAKLERLERAWQLRPAEIESAYWIDLRFAEQVILGDESGMPELATRQADKAAPRRAPSSGTTPQREG